MNYYSKLLLIPLLLILGINPAHSQVKQTIAQNIAQNFPSSDIWAVQLLGIKWEKRVLEILPEYSVEAANTWLIVEVAIQNNSNQRQSVSSIPVLLSSLETVSGNSYLISGVNSLVYSEAKQNPFQLGEVRRYKLMFDVPPSEKPLSINIAPSSPKPNKIRL